MAQQSRPQGDDRPSHQVSSITSCLGSFKRLMPNEPSLSEAKRKLLEQMRRAAPASSDVSEGQLPARQHPIPLSLAQEEVWRLDQIAGKLTPLHNESITI